MFYKILFNLNVTVLVKRIIAKRKTTTDIPFEDVMSESIIG